jgi:hypothetical protein
MQIEGFPSLAHAVRQQELPNEAVEKSCSDLAATEPPLQWIV